METLTLGGQFTTPTHSTISGQAEAVSRPFKLHTARTGLRYLYNDDLPDAGAHIYVEGGPRSQGFGGAIIPFRLVDGTILELRGPWHSNSDALFSATGVDLRSCHVSWGCIGTGRDHKGMASIITNLLHFDPPGGIEGTFSRIEHLANSMALAHGTELAYYSESRGGSQCGFTRAHPKP